MSSGTELAKAYVQIIPSAQGITGKLSQIMGGEAEAAGSSAGSILGKNLGGTLIKAVGALGIGQALKETLLKGADLEQSLGGVETLFKDHANTVIENAKRAYATAGMSANEYMETVTGFSASLLQGVGGNTELAASIADRALIDMADNANKMGTSMESIQNAYQGFAKQNYTMLDNLKLGYGGTQTEMQRLIADAAKMTDVQEKLGVTVDANSMSFDNVINAISVMQENMGIAGATALEASTTFTGSFNSMKAASENFMSTLATGGDIGPALSTLFDTAMIFAIDNLVPMTFNIVSGLVDAIFTTDWITVGTNLITKIQEGVSSSGLNLSVEGISNFVNGILSGLPSLITTVGNVLTSVITYLMQNMPLFLQKGAELILKLANGFIDSLPSIINAMATILGDVLKNIGEHLPEFLQQGITILGELAAGLIKAIPDLVAKIPTIISSITKKFKETDWKTIGKNIIQGIADGLLNAGNIILQAVVSVAGSALAGIKALLGIHSPSRVFRDEVGKMMDLGLAAGITENANEVAKAMSSLTQDTLGVAKTSLNYNARVSSAVITENNDAMLYRLASVEASIREVTEILSAGFDIDWDDRNLGRLVRKYA